VHGREAILIDLETDPARGIDQVYELPGNYARREAGRDCFDSPEGKALDESAHRSAKTNFDFGYAEVEAVVGSMLPAEVDVVYSYDLTSVDIDDLLIEQITFKEDQSRVIRRK